MTPSNEYLALQRVGWLHFYQMRHLGQPSALPRLLVRGEGIYVWDEGGRRFIDGLSGSYCVNVGYGRREILERAQAAAGELHYASPFLAAHPSAVELAERLSALAAPALGADARVFFVNSGSEALDTALKLARAYHRRCGHDDRFRFVARNDSYHGTTLGALSASGFQPMRKDFEPMPEWFEHAVHTLCRRCELALSHPSCGIACADDLVRRLGPGVNPPGGVVLEPFQNCGGNIPPPPGYLERVADRCRETDTLLILDEVICGFGRTGEWFGALRYGVQADVLVCAKGLTSGYESLGAVIVRRRIADVFTGERDDQAFQHGATFGGRPAATAAALENLRILRDEELPAAARERGEELRRLLGEALSGLDVVGEIRGDGLLWGIDLVEPESGNPITDPAFLELISEELFRGGLICRLFTTRLDPVLELAPPLVVTNAQCAEIVHIVVTALRRASALRPTERSR